MTMRKQYTSQSGLSLLELLLAVTLIASIFVAAAQITQFYAERALAKASAAYMQQIADSVDNILKNETNFNALYEIAVVERGLELRVETDPAPAPDRNILYDFTVTPPSTGIPVTIRSQLRISPAFSGLSPLRTGVRILLQQADDPAIATDPAALNYLIVTNEPRPLERVRAAAQQLGAAGGFVGTYGTKATAAFTGALNGWRLVPSIGLSTTAWYASIPASLNALTDGTYLGYLGYKNFQDIASDYLFRRDIAGNTALNSMFGPLNLGGNNIVGADNINVGTQALTTAECDPNSPAGVSLCVRGPVMAKGAVSLQGGMDLTGDLRAERTDNSPTRLMSVNGNVALTGNLVVDSQNASSVDTINVTGNALMSNGATATSATTGSTIAKDVFLPAGGVTTVNSRFTGNRVSATQINAGSSTLNVTGPTNVRNTLINNGPTNISGSLEALTVNAGTLSTPNVNAGTARINNLDVGTFGACGAGCGN